MHPGIFGVNCYDVCNLRWHGQVLKLLILVAGHMNVHCIILLPFLCFKLFYNKNVEKVSKIQVPFLPREALITVLSLPLFWEDSVATVGPAHQRPGTGGLLWPGTNALTRCFTNCWLELNIDCARNLPIIHPREPARKQDWRALGHASAPRAWGRGLEEGRERVICQPRTPSPLL